MKSLLFVLGLALSSGAFAQEAPAPRSEAPVGRPAAEAQGPVNDAFGHMSKHHRHHHHARHHHHDANARNPATRV